MTTNTSTNNTFFMSTPSTDWNFISFLRSKISHGQDIKVCHLKEIFMQFHNELDNYKQTTKDLNVKKYLGRMKKDNQFNNLQLLECFNKAQEHSKPSSSTTVSINFGNSSFQVGDNNSQTIIQASQSHQVPSTTKHENNTTENPSSSNSYSSGSNNDVEDEDLIRSRVNNNEATADMVVDRQQFRKELFQAAYKKLRNDIGFDDIIRLNRMYRALPVPTTIGQCLDDFSYSLIQKDLGDNLLKITLSRIVYRVNEEFSIPLRRHLYQQDLGYIWKQLITTKIVLPEGLDEETIKITNSLIQTAEKEDGTLKINLRTAISRERLELLKNDIVDSTMMQVLDILDAVVASIDTTNSRHELETNTIKSETTYYQRFAVILHILLRDTILDAADGEQTSQVSKDIMTMASKTFDSAIYNENVIGRKIDLMIKSSGLELSTSEWKKKGADKTTGKEQQVKNVRGNKAILKKLLSLPIAESNREKVFVLGMDFIGTFGYMFSVHRADDAYIATPVSDLRIPTELTELHDFVKTLDNLYKFKNHHMGLQSIIDPAYRRHQEDQTLAQLRTPIKRALSNDSGNDDGDDGDRETPDSPNTFYSPRKKRANNRTNNQSDAQ